MRNIIVLICFALLYSCGSSDINQYSKISNPSIVEIDSSSLVILEQVKLKNKKRITLYSNGTWEYSKKNTGKTATNKARAGDDNTEQPNSLYSPKENSVNPSSSHRSSYSGLCGARTKKGGSCRRRVSGGGTCWQH